MCAQPFHKYLSNSYLCLLGASTRQGACSQGVHSGKGLERANDKQVSPDKHYSDLLVAPGIKKSTTYNYGLMLSALEVDDFRGAIRLDFSEEVTL